MKLVLVHALIRDAVEHYVFMRTLTMFMCITVLAVLISNHLREQ